MNHTARQSMIDGQLRPNHVNNALLLARFDEVAREDFVPAAYRKTAYADTATPLGGGRALFAPMTLARLLQTVDIQPDESVLVVAGASGYTAALVAPLCRQVVQTEDDAALLAQAQSNLESHANVQVVKAAPGAGHAAHAPYHVIILDAAAEAIPAALFAQLAKGGRLAAVSVGQNSLLTAAVYTRHGGMLFREDLFETRAPLHPGLTLPEGFVF